MPAVGDIRNLNGVHHAYGTGRCVHDAYDGGSTPQDTSQIRHKVDKGQNKRKKLCRVLPPELAVHELKAGHFVHFALMVDETQAEHTVNHIAELSVTNEDEKVDQRYYTHGCLYLVEQFVDLWGEWGLKMFFFVCFESALG